MPRITVPGLLQATPGPLAGGDRENDGGGGLLRESLNFAGDQTVELLRWLAQFSANLLWAGIIVIAIVWGTGRLRRRLRALLEARVKGRSNLPALVDNVLQIGIYILAALFAFSLLGADSSAFVQAFGLITAAVSLSLQDVLKNFVAGLYLLSEEPFKSGDRLEVAGQVGAVEEVNVRTTVLRNDRAQQVLVPNYQVFSQVVTNRTAYRLNTLTIQVAGIKDDFVTSVDGNLDEVLRDHEHWFTDIPGLPETPPKIELAKVGPEGCELCVTVWVTPGMDLRREVIRRLRERFPEATLTIES